MKRPHLTMSEARVVHGLLFHTWIPKGAEDEFKSVMEKLEVMSRMPEEHPYSNRGVDRGN